MFVCLALIVWRVLEVLGGTLCNEAMKRWRNLDLLPRNASVSVLWDKVNDELDDIAMAMANEVSHDLVIDHVVWETPLGKVTLATTNGTSPLVLVQSSAYEVDLYKYWISSIIETQISVYLFAMGAPQFFATSELQICEVEVGPIVKVALAQEGSGTSTRDFLDNVEFLKEALRTIAVSSGDVFPSLALAGWSTAGTIINYVAADYWHKALRDCTVRFQGAVLVSGCSNSFLEEYPFQLEFSVTVGSPLLRPPFPIDFTIQAVYRYMTELWASAIGSKTHLWETTFPLSLHFTTGSSDWVVDDGDYSQIPAFSGATMSFQALDSLTLGAPTMHLSRGAPLVNRRFASSVLAPVVCALKSMRSPFANASQSMTIAQVLIQSIFLFGQFKLSGLDANNREMSWRFNKIFSHIRSTMETSSMTLTSCQSHARLAAVVLGDSSLQRVCEGVPWDVTPRGEPGTSLETPTSTETETAVLHSFLRIVPFLLKLLQSFSGLMLQTDQQLFASTISGDRISCVDGVEIVDVPVTVQPWCSYLVVPENSGPISFHLPMDATSVWLSISSSADMARPEVYVVRTLQASDKLRGYLVAISPLVSTMRQVGREVFWTHALTVTLPPTCPSPRPSITCLLIFPKKGQGGLTIHSKLSPPTFNGTEVAMMRDVGSLNFSRIPTVLSSTSTDLSLTSTDLSSISTDLSSASVDLSLTSTDLSSISTDLSSISTDLSSTSADLSSISTVLSSTSTDLSLTSTDLSLTSTDLSSASVDFSTTDFLNGTAASAVTKLPSGESNTPNESSEAIGEPIDEGEPRPVGFGTLQFGSVDPDELQYITAWDLLKSLILNWRHTDAIKVVRAELTKGFFVIGHLGTWLFVESKRIDVTRKTRMTDVAEGNEVFAFQNLFLRSNSGRVVGASSKVCYWAEEQETGVCRYLFLPRGTSRAEVSWCVYASPCGSVTQTGQEIEWKSGEVVATATMRTRLGPTWWHWLRVYTLDLLLYVFALDMIYIGVFVFQAARVRCQLRNPVQLFLRMPREPSPQNDIEFVRAAQAWLDSFLPPLAHQRSLWCIEAFTRIAYMLALAALFFIVLLATDALRDQKQGGSGALQPLQFLRLMSSFVFYITLKLCCVTATCCFLLLRKLFSPAIMKCRVWLPSQIKPRDSRMLIALLAFLHFSMVINTAPLLGVVYIALVWSFFVRSLRWQEPSNLSSVAAGTQWKSAVPIFCSQLEQYFPTSGDSPEQSRLLLYRLRCVFALGLLTQSFTLQISGSFLFSGYFSHFKQYRGWGWFVSWGLLFHRAAPSSALFRLSVLYHSFFSLLAPFWLIGWLHYTLIGDEKSLSQVCAARPPSCSEISLVALSSDPAPSLPHDEDGSEITICERSSSSRASWFKGHYWSLVGPIIIFHTILVVFIAQITTSMIFLLGQDVIYLLLFVSFFCTDGLK